MKHFALHLGAILACLVGAVAELRGDPIVTVGSGSALVGSTLTLPVQIAGGADLYAFQFDVSYDPAVLQAISVLEGPFLKSAGSTAFVPGSIDNIAGIVSFTADTLIGPIPGAGGSGDLALLQLEAVSVGSSPLLLSNVVLLDHNFDDIPFTLRQGEAAVVVPEPSGLLLLGLFLLCFLRSGKRFSAPLGLER